MYKIAHSMEITHSLTHSLGRLCAAFYWENYVRHPSLRCFTSTQLFPDPHSARSGARTHNSGHTFQSKTFAILFFSVSAELSSCSDANRAIDPPSWNR